MPKYQCAYFLNDDGVWEPVSYRELTDENVRARMRGRDLRDEKNGGVSLGIRNHPETPHFYRKRPIRQNIDKGGVESEKHDRIVGFLVKFLGEKFDKHAFCYYDRPWAKDKDFEDVVKTKSYEWRKEVGFGLAYGKYIVFDILGRSSKEISLTDSTPYVAVEVVDTHFHSKEAFCALLQLSRNLPFMVIYYYINQYPRINQHLEPGSANAYARLRVHSYVADGSFWIRDSRIEDEDGITVTPDEPEAYYNLIKERLVNEGFVRVQ